MYRRKDDAFDESGQYRSLPTWLGREPRDIAISSGLEEWAKSDNFKLLGRHFSQRYATEFLADYVITLRRDVSQFISSTRLTKTRALIKDVFTSIWDEAEFRAKADEKDDEEENRQREEAVRLLERALILFLPSILEKDGS